MAKARLVVQPKLEGPITTQLMLGEALPRLGDLLWRSTRSQDQRIACAPRQRDGQLAIAILWAQATRSFVPRKQTIRGKLHVLGAYLPEKVARVSFRFLALVKSSQASVKVPEFHARAATTSRMCVRFVEPLCLRGAAAWQEANLLAGAQLATQAQLAPPVPEVEDLFGQHSGVQVVILETVHIPLETFALELFSVVNYIVQVPYL